MPEQPPDPRHYDMRIPPPSDPRKNEESPTVSETDTDTANNSNNREEKSGGGQSRNQNP